MAERDYDDDWHEAMADQLLWALDVFPLRSREHTALINAMNALHSVMEMTDG